MTDEKFQKMITKLEILARKNLRSYKLRVGLLAGLGLGYYLFLILLFAFFTVLFGAGKVFYPALVCLYILIVAVKSMFVRFIPPDGIELTPANAPELFNVLTDLRRHLHLPPLKKVILDENFNAYVMQTPKWFLIGPTERYLVIGLPMMDCLSAEQFKATLGHELGHLSGNHAVFSNWIYRVRAMYGRLLNSMKEGGSASFFVKPFLKRYVPYFDAYSFVLARDNEYDADSIAAQTTSNEIAASGLVTIHVLGRQMNNEFWPKIFKEVVNSPEPPPDIVKRIKDNFWQFNMEETTTLIHENFRIQPSPYDSHPSLAARLQSLGYQAACPEDVVHLFRKTESPDHTAAAILLGQSSHELATQINEKWGNLVRENWHAHRKIVEESLERSKRLNDRANLDVYDALQRIVCLIIQGKNQEAEADLYEYLERPDALTSGNLHLAYVLLKRKDEKGIEYLKKLTPDDGAENLDTALELARDFLIDQGRDDDCDDFVNSMEPVYKAAVELDNRRFLLTKKSKFERHNLTPLQMESLQAMLRNTPMLKNAWIVLKVVEGKPLHLILFERKSKFFELKRSKENGKFIAGIDTNVPVPAQMVIHLSSHAWLRRRVKKVPASQVFPE